MQSLWFIVPAHGRLELARICLTQLRRTVDALEHEGIRASAVVIACDENLDTAREMGFATVERDNRFTSRKFNDGIQLACDPAFNPFPVDYVVPLGSDDWVDWRLFHNLPAPLHMVAFQRMSFVNETGTELTVKHIRSEGGCGIRIIPRHVTAMLGYRPADEHRKRGCDTSMLLNLKEHIEDLRIEHRDLDPLQIVDWKTHGENLNTYADLDRHRSELKRDPFVVLQGRYPAEALTAMQSHYQGALVA
jgi:hypothetical protein